MTKPRVRFVDLHCHSTASDGTLAPAELVRRARLAGLSALALTDHDTVAGIAEAASTAAELDLDFLPGIEISAQCAHPGTMHILGYGVDPQGESLKNLSAELIAERNKRNHKIVEKLNEMGVRVSMQEWQEQAEGDVVGRPHLATVLVRKGYVTSIKQAFDKYIGRGAPAYCDKERLSPRQAIERIHAAAGLAVLAHPTQLRTASDAELDRIVKDLVDLGLDGIEVLHSEFSAHDVERFTQLSDKYSLLKTGGSDFHGRTKPGIELGWANGHRIPREYFDALVARCRESRI